MVENLGEKTVDFLKRLLEKDPKKRISSSEALSHAFFRGELVEEEKKWGSTALEIT